MGWKDWFRVKKLQDFLSPSEQAEIMAAVGRAEGKTSGEVRVHIELLCPKDPLVRAAQVFDRLGMRQTKERNGVLVYCALQDRKFALYGDAGIHQRVGGDFWHRLAAEALEQIRGNHLAAGLCLAVESIGSQLAVHFPRQSNDKNELSDEISFRAR
jgi:uncharacterized membrane protein